MFKIIVLAAAVMLAGAPSARAAQNLTLGHAANGINTIEIAAGTFISEVERKLPGHFKIDEKGGSTLGDEVDAWEAVKIGAIDLAIVATTSIAPLVPQLGVFDVPFLFRDSDHVAKVLDGPIGRELGASVNDHGVVLLAYIDRGARQMTNSKRPIQGPADVTGLKMRVIPNPIFELTFKALGALVEPMPISSVYGALRDNRIDGEENSLLSIKGYHFDRVQRFLSLTAHSYTPTVILINADLYKHLKPEERSVFAAAARAATRASRQAVIEKEKPLIGTYRQEGITVMETVDRDAFIAALAPLEPEWERRFGADLLKRIRETK
jgi:tripartite ATP-independent transporter DctP family solute receptor